MPLVPRLGETVLYRLHERDLGWIDQACVERGLSQNGYRADELVPMVITRDFGGCYVNGLLLLDADFTLPARSVAEGLDAGQWRKRG